MKKTEITGIIVLILLLASLPIGLNLLGQQQIFKSRASGEPIVFGGPNIAIVSGQQALKLSGPLGQEEAVVQVTVTSPIGGPSAPTPTPAANGVSQSSLSVKDGLLGRGKKTVSSFLAKIATQVDAQGTAPPAQCPDTDIGIKFSKNADGLFGSMRDARPDDRIYVRLYSIRGAEISHSYLSDALISYQVGDTVLTTLTGGSLTLSSSIAGGTRVSFRGSYTAANGASCNGTGEFVVLAPQASPPSVSCSSLNLSGGATLSTEINNNGGAIYTIPSSGGNKRLTVTRTPPDVVLEIIPATVQPPSSTKSLTINSIQGQNAWAINFPENTSFTTDDEYQIEAKNGTISCGTPINVKVVKKTTASCDYNSTEVKFRPDRLTDPWISTKTISLRQSVHVYGFHDGETGEQSATDIMLRAAGPGGESITNAAFQRSSGVLTPTQVGSYTITATTVNKTGDACAGTGVLTVTPAVFSTVSFKIAESPNQLAAATPISYDTEPKITPFKFSSTSPGQKFVWVEFNATDGVTERTDRRSASITVLEKAPSIAGLSCQLDLTNGSLIADITGQNFGSTEGTVRINNSQAQLTDGWSEDRVTARSVGSSLPTGGAQRGRDQAVTVVLTRPDGERVTQSCQIGVSTLSLGAKAFCRDDETGLGQRPVEAVIQENFGAGNIIRETATILSDGRISGLRTILQDGKRYKLSLKTTGSLRRTVSFTASRGTTVVPNFTFSLGDLNNDGQINALDYRVLVRSWRGQDSSSSAVVSVSSDLNGDSRVNIFDYACMRYDFNKRDDSEPIQGEIDPEPSASVRPLGVLDRRPLESSLSASPGTASPTPSPSPTSLPTP